MRSEFQFIDDLKSKYSLEKVGDDCAVLPKDDKTDLLVTADLLAEDIDFRLEWTIPEFLGHKALAVSLSDIAAMGGSPKWALMSLGVPEGLWNTDFLDRFYDGWHKLARKYDVELVGGDVSRSPDKLIIDSIAGGEVVKNRALLRSTAKPGDLIYVTDTLGGAAGGLKLLERGFAYDSGSPDHTSDLLLRQLHPEPYLLSAKRLSELDIVTAMIDISDGLSSDLGHICRASGVGGVIDAEVLPLHGDLRHHFPAEQCLDMALNGGEDYQLLYTVSAKDADRASGTRIGEIIPKKGEVDIILKGSRQELPAGGFEHF